MYEIGLRRLRQRRTHLVLHNVPGLSDTIVSSGIVLLLGLVHVLGQDDVHIIPQGIGSNATSQFADEDQSEED